MDRAIFSLPSEQRNALMDDINKRQEMVDKGLISKFYSQPELEQRIIYHCRMLVKTNPKTVKKIDLANHPESTDQSSDDESNDHIYQNSNPPLFSDENVDKIIAAIKQIGLHLQPSNEKN